MQLSGATDPTDSTLQAALVSAAAAELNVSVSMVTLVHIQSGCGGGSSLVDVGTQSTSYTGEWSWLRKQTSIDAELDVQLPPGQTSVDPSQITSDIESSSGPFAASVAAATGSTVSVHVSKSPQVSATMAPTDLPAPSTF